MQRLVLLLLLVVPSPSLAQQAATAAGDPAMATTRMLWEQMTAYVARAAEQMPEEQYGFRPTPEVRSFGEMIGHVAGAQYMFCAAALGEPARDEGDIEKSRTTKAALLEALHASTEYCQRAYRQSDAQAFQTTSLFGQSRTRLSALAMNAMHNSEHYGNLVTYLRINGMVPPSSQPRS